MELFAKDAVIGDFKLSDYGLMLASFDSGSINTEEVLGMDSEAIEEFISDNPVPVYLGYKHNNKLKPTMTIVKNVNIDKRDYFTEHECREVLRQLTGYHGYRTMQIQCYELDELLFFNIRVISVSYRKIKGKVCGIILECECDSQFAWSKDYNYAFNVTGENNLILHNTSDDLYHYLLPIVTIKSENAISELIIKNITDNNWTTVLRNIQAGEVITIDSKHEIITSSNKNRLISNDFNMHFIRLISGRNEFEVNENIKITFNYKVPRKVGFIL